VTQIRDDGDALLFQGMQCLVRETPVVSAGARVSGVVRRSVSQVVNVEFRQEREIVTPVFVVACLRELVLSDRRTLPLDGRTTALDARREHEVSHSPADCFCDSNDDRHDNYREDDASPEAEFEYALDCATA